MPEDAHEYAHHISVTNFINAYYQIRDALTYQPHRVLVIGVGVGIEIAVLRSKFGITVETFDIDPDFQPDHVGSVHDLSRFSDQSFDVVIASHVLEHLPFSFFRDALSELSRVAKHAVIYLPYGGKHLEMCLSVSQRRREWKLRLHVPPVFRRISGEEPELQNNAHYWECGYPGYSVDTIRQYLEEVFYIDGCYHNDDWKYSLNFLLTSRRVEGWVPGHNIQTGLSYHFHYRTEG
jgi:hypothetical protein